MNQSSLHVVLPTFGRGPSPTLDIRHRLQVPKSSRREVRSQADENKYIWGEEEIELIKTCAVLSSSLGLSKSLSTSDITIVDNTSSILRPWVSEDIMNVDLLDGILPRKLEPMSRSCSTWVAVGDVSTSQLPSPQARLGNSDSPAFTAVDFIRSINKKVRQNYIRRRLEMSYRLLRRLSDHCQTTDTSVKREANVLPLLTASPCPPQEVISLIRREVSDFPHSTLSTSSLGPSVVLTTRDVDRDRGRPLTRYERNMIIFNWLQTLEGETFENVN